MEDTSMDNASLKNAIASACYFSSSILDVKTLENADFTDAQFPAKAQIQLVSSSLRNVLFIPPSTTFFLHRHPLILNCVPFLYNCYVNSAKEQI